MTSVVNETSYPTPAIPSAFEPQQPKLSVVTLVDAAALSDKDILSGSSYRRFASDLGQWLGEEYAGHMRVVLSPIGLEYFSLEGRFDRMECKLFPSERLPTCFELETSFYLDAMLVTKATQSGILTRM